MGRDNYWTTIGQLLDNYWISIIDDSIEETLFFMSSQKKMPEQTWLILPVVSGALK